ncbi:MAG: hypothetical protein JWQ09_5637 [Segetibacter sp.]|nr:hypothetical protein [Segetibacter sp.]
MQIALFIFYLIVFSFIISIVPFFKNSGIGRGVLITLFCIKVLAGIAYGKFYTLPKYYANSDTWRFYRLSLEETKWLLKDPFSFIKDLFQYGYNTTGNIFSSENTYWNDLKSNLPVKIMAIFNLLTHNSYYMNIILFNFLFLFGLVALFKVLSLIFPAKKWIITCGVFLLPSTLFWCSGIHKDGLILSAIGITIYCCYCIFKRRFTLKYLLLILLSFILIFSLRNYILFALLAAIFCWLLAEKYPTKKNIIFFGIYFTGIICFFIIPHIFPSINLPLYISIKQQEFLQLSAGSEVKTDLLQPTLAGFISFLPHALDMAFFRPHITEVKNFSYIPAIAENLLLIILIIISVFHINKYNKIPPFVMCLFAFSISILLICGYTIPFTGAIVRYRSLVLPLLITPLLCIADFPFFKKAT